MRKILMMLVLLLFFCVGITAAQGQCVRFKACVDGSDWIKVVNGQLSMNHQNYDAIGTPEDCDQYPNLLNLINVGGNDYPISLVNNPYTINGNDYLTVGIESLTSFNVIDSRGPVTWSDQPNHEILINDDQSSGGYAYTIDLCGEPTTVPTPEFPSAFLPATLIIGILGAVLLIQRTKEN